MERSSPLAALQPPCLQPSWARPEPADYSAGFLAPRPCHAPSNFNFKDLSMLRPPKTDYFDWKPVRGSSPSASLAADLSQNFHIDQTPQAATPRRSLFTTLSHAMTDEQAKLATPPIPSSSPGFDEDSHMDCSPLPHKPAFQAKIEHITNTGLPTPDPTPALEQDGFPDLGAFNSAATLLEPPQLSSPRQRKLSAGRPLLKKGFSSSAVCSRPRSAEAANPPFVFGCTSSRLAASPILESFVESPPSSDMKASPSESGSSLGPLPRLNLCNNGSPVGGSRRISRPRQGLSRRTQSLQYTNPIRPMRSEKRFCSAGALSSVMDVDSVYSLKLPHFRPENDPDGLPRVSQQTLVDVLGGKYIDTAGSVSVIDCRFEYEFEGGHIDGAVNFNDKDALRRELFEGGSFSGSRTLIFHCEYSAHRAPLMAKAIREQDRIVNQDSYPHLTYPEIYILHGGYSSFFQSHRSLCFPQSYKRMDASEHAEDCERGMARVKRRAKLSRAQTYAFGQHNKQSDPVSAPALLSSVSMAERMELDFEQAMQTQSAYPGNGEPNFSPFRNVSF